MLCSECLNSRVHEFKSNTQYMYSCYKIELNHKKMTLVFFFFFFFEK